MVDGFNPIWNASTSFNSVLRLCSTLDAAKASNHAYDYSAFLPESVIECVAGAYGESMVYKQNELCEIGDLIKTALARKDDFYVDADGNRSFIIGCKMNDQLRLLVFRERDGRVESKLFGGGYAVLDTHTDFDDMSEKFDGFQMRDESELVLLPPMDPAVVGIRRSSQYMDLAGIEQFIVEAVAEVSKMVEGENALTSKEKEHLVAMQVIYAKFLATEPDPNDKRQEKFNAFVRRNPNDLECIRRIFDGPPDSQVNRDKYGYYSNFFLSIQENLSRSKSRAERTKANLCNTFVIGTLGCCYQASKLPLLSKSRLHIIKRTYERTCASEWMMLENKRFSSYFYDELGIPRF
jgi:hypothetical protein